jgi:hypothetical protein
VHVSKTRIFARLDAGTQQLVYAMSLSTPADVAMVLPLPVKRDRGEAALWFVDLAGYPTLFEDLERLMAPEAPLAAGLPRGGWAPRAKRPTLAVHTVGAFDASFVPTLADFDRLDQRFRLPEEVWATRPEYAEFGFAVFKLRKGKKQSIHPMALRFDARDPSRVFFPTLHVHDGAVRDRAGFDHALYYQLPADSDAVHQRGDGDAERPAETSFTEAGTFIADRAKGLVDPAARIHRWTLRGMLANTDTLVRIVPRVTDDRRAA